MKLATHRIRRRILAGFTLIELLVVIIILAALAALIVPNIGMYGRSTDMAVSAKSQADIANQVQLFFVTQKRYPQGLDSLLTSGGTVYVATTTAAPIAVNADNQTGGLPYGGADGTRLQSQLTVGTLEPYDTAQPISVSNPDYIRSLTRGGLDWVWDHDPAAVNSNTSNSTFRALVAGVFNPEAAAPVASSAPTSILVAEVAGTAAAATDLRRKLVPTGLKPGERLVAFGFGQKNTSIGKTTTTTPLYPGADKTYYGRYVAYFKIYASGERATLVGVTDAYGRTPDYTQQQFNESLPDGARQG